MATEKEDGRSGAEAPSGCRPTASAANASSQSGIPNADTGVRHLYVAVPRGDSREIKDPTAWVEAFAGYSDRARYHAANLAAHNWDVTLVAGRVLVSSAWSGAHFVNPDTTFEHLPEEQANALYGQPHRGSGRREIVPEALQAIASAIEARQGQDSEAGLIGEADESATAASRDAQS